MECCAVIQNCRTFKKYAKSKWNEIKNKVLNEWMVLGFARLQKKNQPTPLGLWPSPINFYSLSLFFSLFVEIHGLKFVAPQSGNPKNPSTDIKTLTHCQFFMCHNARPHLVHFLAPLSFTSSPLLTLLTIIWTVRHDSTRLLPYRIACRTYEGFEILYKVRGFLLV